MPIKITTLKWVPAENQGYVKDLRIRWALEEIGETYEVESVDFEQAKSPAYRSKQPFSQVPVFQDGDLILFESAAISLHVAEKSEILMPLETTKRARAAMWVISALSSVEPFVQNLNRVTEDVTSDRSRNAATELERRFEALSDWLAQKAYLEETFSVGDLIMASVLREVPPNVLAKYPVVDAYLKRCLSRPAFKQAHSDQMRFYSAT